jgi:hypothetical protein
MLFATRKNIVEMFQTNKQPRFFCKDISRHKEKSKVDLWRLPVFICLCQNSFFSEFRYSLFGRNSKFGKFWLENKMTELNTLLTSSTNAERVTRISFMLLKFIRYLYVCDVKVFITYVFSSNL